MDLPPRVLDRLGTKTPLRGIVKPPMTPLVPEATTSAPLESAAPAAEQEQGQAGNPGLVPDNGDALSMSSSDTGIPGAAVKETPEEGSPVLKARPAGARIPARKPGQAGMETKRPSVPRPAYAESDSLPVLAAFQDFIDVERGRTRRAITVLATMLTVVLCVAIGAAVLVGRYYLTQVRGDLAENREAAIAAGVRIDAVSKEFENETKRLAGQMSDSVARYENTESGVQALDSKLAGAIGDMDALKNQLSTMAGDKDKTLKEFSDALATMTNRIASLSRENELLRDEILGSYSPRNMTLVPRMPEDGSLSVDMILTNLDDTVKWRLPMPR